MTAPILIAPAESCGHSAPPRRTLNGHTHKRSRNLRPPFALAFFDFFSSTSWANRSPFHSSPLRHLRIHRPARRIARDASITSSRLFLRRAKPAIISSASEIFSFATPACPSHQRCAPLPTSSGSTKPSGGSVIRRTDPLPAYFKRRMPRSSSPSPPAQLRHHHLPSPRRRPRHKHRPKTLTASGQANRPPRFRLLASPS